MRRYGLFTSCLVFLFMVAWSSIAHAECPNEPRDPCSKLTVFAKSGVASKPICIVQKDCSVLGCDDCVFHIEWKVKLKSKDIEVCDESVKQQLIPEGSYLKVELDYHIRKNGPCGSPVGTHLGDFKLYNAENVLIGAGDMGGTNGLETHVLLKECCKWPHDEGTMIGTIHNCQLRASYKSSLTPPKGVIDVCSKEYWRNWKLKIDGVILCPCIQVAQ